VNRLDQTAGRQVWHNFWETKLTYQKSYLARLNYVHQNAVKHGLVPVATQYPWCSAGWFERNAAPAMVRAIFRFKTDRIRVPDEFEPVMPGMIAESGGAPPHSTMRSRLQQLLQPQKFA
jgi:putative transposase